MTKPKDSDIKLPEREKPSYFDKHFIKRPDLRPEEFNPEVSINELNSNPPELWLNDLDLIDQEKANGDSGSAAWAILTALQPWERPERITPFEILNHFCGYHDLKVHPPGWVMNALYEIFNDYITKRNTGMHCTLGELFGENRANDWQRVTAPMMETACFHVYYLINWFSRSREKALDIVSRRLDAAQVSEKLPAGWQNRVKKKSRSALEKEYIQSKNMIEEVETDLRKRHPVTTEKRDALLLTLGEDALIGENDLLDRLHHLKTNNT